MCRAKQRWSHFQGTFLTAQFERMQRRAGAHARDAKWSSSLVSRGPNHSRVERRRERGNRVVRHHPSAPHSLPETRWHIGEALGRRLVALTESMHVIRPLSRNLYLQPRDEGAHL